ncbi:MAG TPA: DNA repair protein RecN [Candidatus Baltobacteraceae bacterium]|nr:DNA repair protein RecN [Candidatus Baltobacteraceae bacterium]
MLRRLEIENYGLIARADVDFAAGATIFTGETGSGKTMLLGALTFALGARAGADVVRRGAARAIVALAFEPSGDLAQRLEADGFGVDPGEECTIAREMSDGGRSSVRVNGRPSTAGYAREIADGIAEIVGQHEAQRLLSPAYHLELLDRFGGAQALEERGAVARAFAEASDVARALDEVKRDDRSAQTRYEDAAFALREIEGSRVQSGEDARLEERRHYLDNVERVAGALRAAHESLADEEAGAVAGLGSASAALAAIRDVGTELRESADRATALQSEAVDLAATIARSLEATEYDPAELEAINARLDVLDRLKRKYGGALEAVLERAESARAIVEEYEGRDRRFAELEARNAAALEELKRRAATLTASRKKAASALSKRVVGEFSDIALSSGRFEAAFTTMENVGAGGAERVEFLFAANAGEPARPLSRVASGGELSRVLLALVVVLASTRGEANALVFDEIDAGIGGATAIAVGARIGRLAGSGQVMCVTHLAQLATWADRHYVLEKSENKKETTISVREIAAAPQREEELARMLSGETHDAALEHARALLKTRA